MNAPGLFAIAEPIDPIEAAAGRARELAAVLYAIDAGELLAAVPRDPGARAAHAAGISLLAVADRELRALVADLDAAARHASPH